MHHDIETILLSSEHIQERIITLGQTLTRDYQPLGDLVIIGVLKGCTMFMMDLIRAIDMHVTIDFIATSSYGSGTHTSGVVRLLKDLDMDIANRHVLIVEDIIDSGLTLAYLHAQLQKRNPASMRICTLLNKPARRDPSVTLSVDYLGFDIPNEFVVGYGLDYAEHYRNLPYIGVLKPSVYTHA